MEYVERNPELCLLPLSLTTCGGEAGQTTGVAEIRLPDGTSLGRLDDALTYPAFARALLDLIQQREHLDQGHAQIEAIRTGAGHSLPPATAAADPVIQNTDEGNVIAVFSYRVALKFFRRPGQGTNPELETGLFLTDKKFAHSPPVMGALEYQGRGQGPATVAIARGFIPQAKTAWEFTLDAASRFYDRVFASAAQGHSPEAPPAIGPLKLLSRNPGAETTDHVGTYLESARLLGVRTAELHRALASGPAGSAFAMEPMTSHYLRGVFQSMRSLAAQNLRLLRKRAKSLPPDLAPVAQQVAELEPAILQIYRPLLEQRFDAGRIRIHGDCHLGQILWTGRDFVFLDFEGDVSQPVSERRIKCSPLRDVARMVRSFHHAAYAGFHQQVERGVITQAELPKFEPWFRHWNRTVSRAYLQAYCETQHGSGILPAEEDPLRALLLAYVVSHVVDELGVELRQHSDNVRAPLQALLHLTEEPMLVHMPDAAGTRPPAKPA